MSDATDWDEERAWRSAESEAQCGDPDGHICIRCHGEGYVTNFAGEPDDCAHCGMTGLEPEESPDA